jgi:hypothetical protein
MAERYATILSTDRARARAKELIDEAPDGFVAVLHEPRRSLDQNDKMWAMLTDISRAEPLGRKHTPDDWKAILMNACGWECQFIEGLDGRPFPQGFKSSQLSRRQMADLITYMMAFGAEQGVEWSEPKDEDA